MTTVALPAPYGGLNGFNVSGVIPPEQAVYLFNLVPGADQSGTGYVSTRGATRLATNNNPGSYVYSLWDHPSGVGITAAGLNLYKPFQAAPLATGFSSDFWHGNVFKDRTILCNAADTPQVYDGTAVTALVATGTGLTMSNLYGSHTFKGRVYYWEYAQRFFWYAAAGAYQGTLSKFDLSAYMATSGYVVSICTLTNDGGDGPDDLFCVLCSTGEVIIYQGDDPSSAMAWQMSGRFKIGTPMGRSCWHNIGGTTIVATTAGVVDLLTALRVGPADRSAAFGTNLGTFWQDGTPDQAKFVYDPTEGILWLANWVQAEVEDNGLNQVFGMDLDSRAWFMTDGIGYRASPLGTASRRATAIGSIGTSVYFAATSTGGLYYAPPRDSDGTTTDEITGVDINYYSRQGYQPLGGISQKKQVTAVAIDARPLGTSSPNITEGGIQLIAERDGNIQSVIYAANGTQACDSAFRSVNGYGSVISLVVYWKGKGGLQWYASRLMVKAGGET